MANSTTNIDTIASGQLQPEVTANQYFDAASPATLFGRRGSATSGLTWAYYGGRMYVDGVLTAIANGTVTLTSSNTNYVEATRAGVVSCNTTGFTAGRIPLYTVVVGASAPTSYTDERAWVDPAYMTHTVSIAITSSDVTMTAAQARARHINLTGTLTGNRNLIVPNNGEWVVYNNTSGAFTVTVKTASGSGDTVDQGSVGWFFSDGTDVIALATGGGGGGVDELAELTDVDLSGLSDGDALVYDSGSGKWIPGTVAGASELDDLSDVDIPSPSLGDVLTYDGTKWIAQAGAAITVQCIPIACSDETTALTTGTKVTFRMPYPFTLSEVRASLTTAQSSGSTFTVDIKESGTTILSTKITIDNTEKTSTTATTPPVISDDDLADDAEITVIIDQVGDGTAKGLKVYLIGVKA
jgi:hypothetical protein